MSEWQPIVTSPKDGSWVLVHARDPYWEKGEQTEWVATYADGVWWHEGREYSVHPDPTHWMPLPDPPDVSANP